MSPRCVVIDPHFDWGDDRPLRTPWGYTNCMSEVLRANIPMCRPFSIPELWPHSLLIVCNLVKSFAILSTTCSSGVAHDHNPYRDLIRVSRLSIVQPGQSGRQRIQPSHVLIRGHGTRQQQSNRCYNVH